MKMVGTELLLRPDFVCGGQNPPQAFIKNAQYVILCVFLQ